MKSHDIVEWGQPLRTRTRPVPVPSGREVLLRISHCGVCHTDVHIRDGYYDLGGDRKISFADRGFILPITLGHEPVGVVEAAGEAVPSAIVGKRFLVNPWIGCGQCRMCAADNDQFCDAMQAVGMGGQGGFATHLLIRDPAYLVDIDGLDPAQAAPLACSGLTTYSAIKKLMPIDPRDWIAVIGCGGLGSMAIAILRGLGHERVVACDIDDAKLDAARALGAQATFRIGHDGTERLREIAEGTLYGVLDFVGSADTVALALPALRRGGRLVVCGLFGGSASVPIPPLALREISILGSAVGSTRDLVELVDLVKQGRVTLPKVESRPVAAAEQSLVDLQAGRVIGRIVLTIDEAE
ncbi:MAG: alcohol dehydrogenase [Luteimonas sp.]